MAYWNFKWPHAKGWLGAVGIEPGSPDLQFQIHVAMSRCTNWPPNLSIKVITAHSMVKTQKCMIYHCDRTNVLVKMIYISYNYVLWLWPALWPLLWFHFCLHYCRVIRFQQCWEGSSWFSSCLEKWRFLKQNVDYCLIVKWQPPKDAEKCKQI